jgi:hypothetical protein
MVGGVKQMGLKRLKNENSHQRIQQNRIVRTLSMIMAIEISDFSLRCF